MKLGLFQGDIPLAIANEFRRWAAVINMTWRVQHNDDGTHGFAWTRYTPSSFTAATGTWTVDAADIVQCQYVAVGKVLHLVFQFETTTVSNANNRLSFAMPAGVTPVSLANGAFWFLEPGVGSGLGMWQVGVTTNSVVQLFKPDLSNWAASTNLTYMRGSITFAIA